MWCWPWETTCSVLQGNLRVFKLMKSVAGCICGVVTLLSNEDARKGFVWGTKPLGVALKGSVASVE